MTVVTIAIFYLGLCSDTTSYASVALIEWCELVRGVANASIIAQSLAYGNPATDPRLAYASELRP